MKTFEDLVKLGMVKTGTLNPPQTGGQSCGIIRRIVFVEIEDLGIRIECQAYRSNIKSLELAKKMIKSVLPELT